MQRRIIGSYQSSKEVVSEIEKLMNEGYVGEEILIITDSKSEHQKELENLSLVEVDAVDPNEGLSFWEKTKEVLSFGKYDNHQPDSPLKEYGVDENQAEPYKDALQEKNILLLVDSHAPAQLEKSVAPDEEEVESSKDDMKEDYEPAPGDEETFDPSKAQSSREDKLTEEEKEEIEKNDALKVVPGHGNGDVSSGSAEKQRKAEKEAASGENDNLLDDPDAPQLTGDETSVTHTGGTHKYPDDVNEGPINTPRELP